jgi:hypothetical protein
VGSVGLPPETVGAGEAAVAVGATVVAPGVELGAAAVEVGLGLSLSFSLVSSLSSPQPAIAKAATIASARNLFRVFMKSPP